MNLFEEIKNYKPENSQEARDKEQMLSFMQCFDNYLDRENQFAHFTASMWTLNKEHTKTLMVHHNQFQTWSWIGGHADGMEDLCEVALKELKEETSVKNPKVISKGIFSLETLTVNGHVKKGIWVPGHIHFNLTYLAEVNEHEQIEPQIGENTAVQWCTFEEALKESKETWMIETVYKKLIEKSKYIA